MHKLLVVDDHPRIIDFVVRILAREGYQIETTTDGRQALETITTSPPDLLILDVIMPHLSGLDILEAMATNPSTVSVPVILLTALDEEMVPIEHLSPAMDLVVLTKPFHPEMLRSLIREKLLGV